MVAKPRACLVLWTLGAVFSGCLLLGQSQTWAKADPALIAKGEKVYAGKKCALCHKIAGQGGKIGGDLSKVGAKGDAQWLTSFMKHPKAMKPKAKMMPFKGSEEELNDLVAYLSSLK